ncbi:MAG: zinc ABC transporter substrate-binding protein [Candidatus Aminicenantes bacterium]|nr:zinc ABC transporter substrate-binding protein [Candidatus Aminicenantes bacterium]
MIKTAALLTVFLSLFSGRTGHAEEAHKLKVLASIYPLMEFSQAVAGEAAEVHLLIPPGAEVHTWQPRPSDVLKLAQADIFVIAGQNLEPWANDLIKGAGNERLRIFEAASVLDMPADKSETEKNKSQKKHKGMDPHIWLDLGIDTLIVDKLADLFSSLRPDKSVNFRGNAADYKKKLIELDERFRSRLKKCRIKTLVIAGHAAFGYLAGRYGLEQVSVYGLSPNAEPTPTHLIKITQWIREKGIQTVFFEVAVGDRMAKTLARETGVRMLVLNPGANLSRREFKEGESFLRLMENNLENICLGLNCPKK